MTLIDNYTTKTWKTSALIAAEAEGLTVVLRTIGMLRKPNQGNIQDTVLTAATSLSIDRSMAFVQLAEIRFPNVCKETFLS